MGRLEYVAARSRASTSCRMRSRRWPCRSGSARQLPRPNGAGSQYVRPSPKRDLPAAW